MEYKTWDPNTNKTGSTILKEWTTPDSRNTPSTTNLEEEEIVDALGNDGNASKPEQVNHPNQWRIIIIIIIIIIWIESINLSSNFKILELNRNYSQIIVSIHIWALSC